MADELRLEQEPFTMVPAWVLDAEISDRAVRLYGILRRIAGGAAGADTKCFPARSTLAKRLRCSTDTVDRALTELDQIGAVSKKGALSDRGDRTSNVYTVHWHDRTGAAPSRSDAATLAAPMPPPPPHGCGIEEESVEGESISQDAEPPLGADLPSAEAEVTAPRTRRTRAELDDIAREADRVAREWWEATNPRPSIPGGFAAARKRIESFMRNGWSAAELAAALPEWRSWTNGQLEQVLQRRRRAREARDEQSERQLLDQWGRNPASWPSWDRETIGRLRKALDREQRRRTA